MTHPNFYLETKQDALEHVYISGFNIWLSENSGYEVFGALGLYIYSQIETQNYTLLISQMSIPAIGKTLYNSTFLSNYEFIGSFIVRMLSLYYHYHYHHY